MASGLYRAFLIRLTTCSGKRIPGLGTNAIRELKIGRQSII